MAEKQITIRISAVDSFSSVIQKYQQAMGQAASDTEQFNTATGTSAGGVDDLTNAIGNAVKGFVAFKAVGMVAELVQIGGKANVTQAAFDALSGSSVQAAANLQMMRDATGGIVADMDLMQAGNKLFQMGLAQTGEEASHLAATAIRLGQALGRDVNEAFADFSQMLAQGSIMRLDNFGLSSVRVKERMEELKEEFPELDRQARFVKATMEEAEKAIGRLGDSFDAAQTPIARLEARFDNFKTKVGQIFADVLNNAITTFDQLGVVIEHSLGTTAVMSPDQEQAVINNAQAYAQKWGETFASMVGTAGMPADFNGVEMLQRIEETRQRLGPNADAGAMVQMAGEDMWYSQNNIDRMKMVYAQITQIAKAEEDHAQRMTQYDASMNAFRMAEQGANQASQASALNEMYKRYYGGGAGAAANPYQSLIDWAGGSSGMDAYNKGAAERQYASDKLYQFQTNTGDIGKFLDPAVFDDIKARFEELQQLNEKGLISDESLQKAETFKNQAQEAANAFKDMSLTDIFGQTSGGMKGQIGDMVIAQMKKNGASDEAIAAAQQNFDLASGRETNASLAMQNTVAPMIANLSPEQQTKAIENINSFLEAAAKLNLSPDQIAAGMGGASGFAGSGTGQTFSIAPGQTPGEVARDLKISVDQLLAIVGAPNARSVQPGTYSIGTGYQAVPGFNPASYAAGFGNQQGTAATNSGANPFVAAGFATQGVIDAGQQGKNAGADPADKMKDMEDSSSNLADNMQAVADQLNEMDTKATSFNDTLDLASKSREMTFTVNVKDNTKGLLELLLNAKQFANLSFATEGAAGGSSVRDRGGSAANLGVSPTASQRPGVPS